MNFFGFSEKSPEDVFTPRSPEVNDLMYINRPLLEESLLRGVRLGYHIVIYGDSGCGKSWLYKRVFADQRIFFDILDFSASENADDVDLQILDMLSSYEEWRETEKMSSVEGGLNPGGVGVNKARVKKFARADSSPLAKLMRCIRAAAGKRRKAFLVLENIEHILDNADVVRRVQNMLLALDDPQLAKFDVKLCLVGVPAEIKEVLTAGNKYQTISNRVAEIPEVDRLSIDDVRMLVTRGLQQLLDLEIESKTYCTSLIGYISDRVPQFVHDVCLHAAILAEDNALRVTPDLLDQACENWIAANSRQSYEFVCSCLEKRGHMSAARARIAFAISKCELRRFTAQDIEEIARAEFSNELDGRRMQTLRSLRELSSGDHRLLKTDEEGRSFRLITPKLRPVMRTALCRGDGNSVFIKRI